MTARPTQGFTLIELMIVVAIIAILAGMAIGAYQDYIIRTQVAECGSLAGPVQLGALEYYADQGVFPTSNLQAGLPAGDEYEGAYISRVELTAAGDVACTFSSTAPQQANGELDGASMLLTPIDEGGSVNWECSSTTISSYRLATICR
ncbi:prepilin-type cleavage/methylation domain-containing protein [Ahniella affigens]|uniref:Prepilin-type cleavage/methylation domain-containing protein n=1 Tax=Ahniella affigens TaxID=2021234 RepID=A0A2P1PWA6_9GAMM|nr:pilin [Ahniella affigens]AVP99120.1 prepilin-type cleavage/methylation domain-containing protein [Ahniella affigens]